MISSEVPLLSIDPSSTKIGWALLGLGPHYLTSGVYYCPGGFPPDERVLTVGPGITAIIEKCHQVNCFPALALIEIPDFAAVYVRSHITVYFRAVGVAEYALHLSGIPFKRVNASIATHKQRKETGKKRFRQIVGRFPAEDDESDALVMGWDYLLERNRSCEA